MIDIHKAEIQSMQPKSQDVNFSPSFCAKFRYKDN